MTEALPARAPWPTRPANDARAAFAVCLGVPMVDYVFDAGFVNDGLAVGALSREERLDLMRRGEEANMITKLPGGSEFNTGRLLSWMTGSRGASTVFIGAVGSDSDADFVRSEAKRAHVQAFLAQIDGRRTGRCGVVVRESERYLFPVTDAGAALCEDALKPPEVSSATKDCRAIFLGAFNLVAEPNRRCVMELVNAHPEALVVLSLSAKHILKEILPVLRDFLPRVAVVVGSDEEFLRLGTLMLGKEDMDLLDAAEHVTSCLAPQSVAFVTCGADPTVVLVNDGAGVSMREVPSGVGLNVVDTTGAGDAFAAGVLAYLLHPHASLSTLMDHAHYATFFGQYCAERILQQHGCPTPRTPVCTKVLARLGLLHHAPESDAAPAATAISEKGVGVEGFGTDGGVMRPVMERWWDLCGEAEPIFHAY